MSLRIKHLNGDSSFLLIFSPPYAPHNPQGTFPGSFTILIDPWIDNGPSRVFASAFARTTRVIPSCIDSLADLPDPDVVIVSQDKPDHCHQDTLLQLPSDTAARIYAPASAAKRIKSWRHFDPDQVHSLPRYDEQDDLTVMRIPIPCISAAGHQGEVTITLLSSRVDVMGLHNGIALTYRPPSTVLSSSASYINLPPPAKGPLTPPATPPMSTEGSRTSLSSSLFRFGNLSTSSISRPRTPSSPTSQPSFGAAPRERAISVLYSPHGVSYALVKPYATSHLLAESALPLTALLHSFDRVTNPWYLGGIINSGSIGGLQIAKGLSAKCWISAHDEDKHNSGISTMQLKTERASREQIRRMLDQTPVSPSMTNVRRSKTSVRKTTTTLMELEAGEEYFVAAR